MGSRTGALAPGMAADLVVVEGDPLMDDFESLRNPAAVLRGGQQVDLTQ